MPAQKTIIIRETKVNFETRDFKNAPDRIT